MTALPVSFARALEAGRERFNALFAQARRDTPRLDPDAFTEHLRRNVAPIVEAVAGVAPDRLGDVVEVLYELSLELVGKEILGPRTRYPALNDGWGRLLPALPRLLAAEPRWLAGSLSNALHQLSTTPDARPTEWIDTLLDLGPRCADIATLLDVGKVAAWRAGLAHYRDGALQTGATLEPSLVRRALGLSAEGPALEELVNRLRDDPWLRPADAARPASAKQLNLVRRVGAFRGFGGSFLRPPRVVVSEGQFFVADGESCWLLTADHFGATLHRAGIDLPDPGKNARFHVESDGKVVYGKHHRGFDELKNRTSFAATATTLAVTVPLSHSVFLVALTQGAS